MKRGFLLMCSMLVVVGGCSNKLSTVRSSTAGSQALIYPQPPIVKNTGALSPSSMKPTKSAIGDDTPKRSSGKNAIDQQRTTGKALISDFGLSLQSTGDIDVATHFSAIISASDALLCGQIKSADVQLNDDNWAETTITMTVEDAVYRNTPINPVFVVFEGLYGEKHYSTSATPLIKIGETVCAFLVKLPEGNRLAWSGAYMRQWSDGLYGFGRVRTSQDQLINVVQKLYDN